ncbi:MAG TPA: polysaccharide deacetylase family protein [Oculatellaceae cyanobacterium]
MSSKPDTTNNWSDHVSLFRMSCLTSLGKSMLPPGFWGDASSNGANNGTASSGTLYLTFDDGPNPNTTPGLLEILKEENVPATFFLIGQQIARHKELAVQMVQNGHQVGNHSYQHEFMPGMPLKRIQEEVDSTNSLLDEITNNSAPKLFRPPYGILDNRTAQYLKQAGMSIVYWTIVPEDWQRVGAARIVERVTKNLSAGSVIVLHEGSSIAEQTLTATREIIKRAKDRGYEFGHIPTESLAKSA